MRKEKLMSNENLHEQFVEDAPQQVNELENVRSLSNYVIDLQKLEEGFESTEEIEQTNTEDHNIEKAIITAANEFVEKKIDWEKEIQD